MQITLDILLEAIGSGTVLCKPKLKVRYSLVLWSLDALQHCPSLSQNEPVLFIGNLQDACAALNRDTNLHALAFIAESDSPDIENSVKDRTCMLVVPYEVSHARGVCEAEVARYELWQDAMKTALLNDGDYQNILTCSEDLLGNFVSISDSAFRLLAYTKGIPIDDPIPCSLIEHGHHVPKTIERFRKRGLDKTWSKRSGLGIWHDSVTSYSETIDYVFKMHGEYFTHVVMHCNNRPISDGLVDTFSIMVDHMNHYVQRDWRARKRIGPEYGRTLVSLLAGKLYRSPTAEEELRLARIDKDAAYRVYAFSFDDEQPADNQQGISYYLYRLLDLMPDEKAVAYDGKVVLLHKQSEAGYRQFDAQVALFQNTYEGVCGVSNTVDSIFDIPFAYQQACHALKQLEAQTLRLEGRTSGTPRERIVHFGLCYPDYLLLAPKDDRLLAFCLKNSITMHIKHDDEHTGTDNLGLLCAYLVGERKASTVCTQLHMHRNTLLYRIESMRKRYKFDLDDENVRRSILLEHALIRALESNPGFGA